MSASATRCGHKKLQKPDILTVCDRKKLMITIPSLRVTVKPALGNHPFIKLKVVAQNRWSLNDGSLTGTGIVTIEFVTIVNLCKWQLANTIVMISQYRLLANYWCISFLLYTVPGTMQHGKKKQLITEDEPLIICIAKNKGVKLPQCQQHDYKPLSCLAGRLSVIGWQMQFGDTLQVRLVNQTLPPTKSTFPSHLSKLWNVEPDPQIYRHHTV